MRRLLIGLLTFYKRRISPLLPRSCRFTPTCSEYARLALLKHGVLRGSWRAGYRVLRCQPFGTSGLDFVADTPPPRARWYLPWRYGRWRGTNTVPPRA